MGGEKRECGEAVGGGGRLMILEKILPHHYLMDSG